MALHETILKFKRIIEKYVASFAGFELTNREIVNMTFILLLKAKELLSDLTHTVFLVTDNLVFTPFLTIPPVD